MAEARAAPTSRPQRRFSAKVRKRCLLWCARHCCLCGTNCGLDIEIHHIEDDLPSGLLNEEDNAMPVCYRCHADLERSKYKSPRGSSYVPAEIKARRQQVYEDHTRHLVPPVAYQPCVHRRLPTKARRFQKVMFQLHNPHGGLPVRVKTVVQILIGGRFYGQPIRHYSGERLWNCNPGIPMQGNFDLANDSVIVRSAKYRGRHPRDITSGRVRLRVDATVYDVLDFPHPRLPLEWYYDWREEAWVLDP